MTNYIIHDQDSNEVGETATLSQAVALVRELLVADIVTAGIANNSYIVLNSLGESVYSVTVMQEFTSL